VVPLELFAIRYVPLHAALAYSNTKQGGWSALIKVVLKQVVNHAKNGYLVRSPQLGLAAYGSTLELASRNLERLALLYLRPFERERRLVEEIRLAGLHTETSDGELAVCLTD
jgi:hypothetical protein